MPSLFSCFSSAPFDDVDKREPQTKPSPLQPREDAKEVEVAHDPVTHVKVFIHDRRRLAERAADGAKLRVGNDYHAESGTLNSGTTKYFTVAREALKSSKEHPRIEFGGEHFKVDLHKAEWFYEKATAGAWETGYKNATWRRIESSTVKDNQKSKVWGVQTIPHSRSAEVHLLAFSAADPARWMSSLPDTAPLSSLCIPGTHETLARYGYPISTCQEVASTVDVQLRAGIRFFDIRVNAKGEGEPSQQTLHAFHGITDERIEFSAVLDACWKFLDNEGKGETLFMSIKAEGDAQSMVPCFEQVYLNPTKSRWFLENRIPTLGEARGKIILFSRYTPTAGQPTGVHPPTWPDSLKDTFDYTLPSGQRVITQDWYNIGSLGSLDDKFALGQKLLSQCGSDPAVLGLTFSSASSFPLAFPPAVAMGALGYTGMNARLSAYIKDALAKATPPAPPAGKQAKLAPAPWKGAVSPLMAIFNIDYYGSEVDLVPMLISANFQS